MTTLHQHKPQRVTVPVPMTHDYYYSKDHLGNVRSVVTKDASTNTVTEVQKTHYYPFGGIIADLSTGRSVQNRLYNGKELDTSNNLWWYDYGARQYDPTAPRFTTADPLAEKYYGWNMYAYCMNNPVMFIDPDGRDGYLIIWASSEEEYGHAAFAVDNYKFDEHTSAYVPDGTVTVYDLFPGSNYNSSDAVLDVAVPASYEEEKSKLNDIIRGGTSREDKKPDGVISIEGNASLGAMMHSRMKNLQNNHKNYMGQSWNCSSYAREGVRTATGVQIKGEETFETFFSDYNYVTPNALYNATKNLKGTREIVKAGNKTNYQFSSTVNTPKRKK